MWSAQSLTDVDPPQESEAAGSVHLCSLSVDGGVLLPAVSCCPRWACWSCWRWAACCFPSTATSGLLSLLCRQTRLHLKCSRWWLSVNVGNVKLSIRGACSLPATKSRIHLHKEVLTWKSQSFWSRWERDVISAKRYCVVSGPILPASEPEWVGCKGQWRCDLSFDYTLKAQPMLVLLGQYGSSH